MQELKEKYRQWTTFTEDRETEREKVMNPPGAAELKEQIATQQSVVLKAQAELQMLKARLVLSGNGDTPYRAAEFNHEWSRKKSQLKADVERLIGEQIEANVSIPKIMRELQCRNPAWLYQIRENLNSHRGAAKEVMSSVTWYWSDVTSVHRYGLGHSETGSDWGFVLMHGAVDSEHDGEKCMFEYSSLNFIGGNKALFDSVTSSVKQQRTRMLADILDGTYTKKLRRDTNPYFEVN